MFQKIKKNLIIDSLTAFFVISVLFLFWSAERPLQEKWWAIHFEEFKGDNFNFILENHSGEKKFHYEIWQEEEKVQEKEFECLKEECLIEIKDFDKNNFQGKIFLKIFGRDEKKEIYKNKKRDKQIFSRSGFCLFACPLRGGANFVRKNSQLTLLLSKKRRGRMTLCHHTA